MKKVVFSIFFMALAACGADAEQKDLLRVGIKTEPTTLFPYGANDAATGNMAVQLFENLIAKDIDGNLVPELATSWEFTSPTNIVMSIRSGVTFHNGEILSVEDVKYSIERMIATPTIKHIVGAVEGVDIIDEHTIQLNLNKPFVPILAHLSHQSMVILNKKAAEEAGEDIDTMPVGTGQYKLSEWTRGQSILLTRHENHWRENAKIKDLFFMIIPEDSTRIIALESGEIDISMQLAAVNRERIQGNSDLKLLERPLAAIDYFAFNQKDGGNPLWKDRRVREAAALAIDVPGIVNAVYFGAAQPSPSLPFETMVGYYDGIPLRTQNINRAKELIKEAGVEGAKLSIWAVEGERQKIAEVIQANLTEIGLDAEILVIEWARFYDGLGKGEHDGLVLSWIDGTGDVDYTLYNMMHSSTRGVGGNRSFYSNPALDVLLENARTEIDPVKRVDIYRQAQEIIHEDVAIVPLLHKLTSVATSKRVAGYHLMSTDEPIYATVYFTE